MARIHPHKPATYQPANAEQFAFVLTEWLRAKGFYPPLDTVEKFCTHWVSKQPSARSQAQWVQLFLDSQPRTHDET